MTTRTRALVGSFVFFWVAPAVVAGVGPLALVGWTMQPPLLGLPGERVVGVAAVAAGLACLLDCFALEGRWHTGTGGADRSTGGVRPLSLVRTKGSHRQYRHLDKPGTVTIAGKLSDDLPRGALGAAS